MAAPVRLFSPTKAVRGGDAPGSSPQRDLDHDIRKKNYVQHQTISKSRDPPPGIIKSTSSSIKVTTTSASPLSPLKKKMHQEQKQQRMLPPITTPTPIRTKTYQKLAVETDQSECSATAPYDFSSSSSYDQADHGEQQQESSNSWASPLNERNNEDNNVNKGAVEMVMFVSTALAVQQSVRMNQHAALAILMKELNQVPFVVVDAADPATDTRRTKFERSFHTSAESETTTEYPFFFLVTQANTTKEEIFYKGDFKWFESAREGGLLEDLLLLDCSSRNNGDSVLDPIKKHDSDEASAANHHGMISNAVLRSSTRGGSDASFMVQNTNTKHCNNNKNNNTNNDNYGKMRRSLSSRKLSKKTLEAKEELNSESQSRGMSNLETAPSFHCTTRTASVTSGDSSCADSMVTSEDTNNCSNCSDNNNKNDNNGTMPLSHFSRSLSKKSLKAKNASNSQRSSRSLQHLDTAPRSPTTTCTTASVSDSMSDNGSSADSMVKDEYSNNCSNNNNNDGKGRRSLSSRTISKKLLHAKEESNSERSCQSIQHLDTVPPSPSTTCTARLIGSTSYGIPTDSIVQNMGSKNINKNDNNGKVRRSLSSRKLSKNSLKAKEEWNSESRSRTTPHLETAPSSHSTTYTASVNSSISDGSYVDSMVANKDMNNCSECSKSNIKNDNNGNMRRSLSGRKLAKKTLKATEESNSQRSSQSMPHLDTAPSHSTANTAAVSSRTSGGRHAVSMVQNMDSNNNKNKNDDKESMRRSLSRRKLSKSLMAKEDSQRSSRSVQHLDTLSPLSPSTTCTASVSGSMSYGSHADSMVKNEDSNNCSNNKNYCSGKMRRSLSSRRLSKKSLKAREESNSQRTSRSLQHLDTATPSPSTTCTATVSGTNDGIQANFMIKQEDRNKCSNERNQDEDNAKRRRSHSSRTLSSRIISKKSLKAKEESNSQSRRRSMSRLDTVLCPSPNAGTYSCKASVQEEKNQHKRINMSYSQKAVLRTGMDNKNCNSDNITSSNRNSDFDCCSVVMVMDCAYATTHSLHMNQQKAVDILDHLELPFRTLDASNTDNEEKRLRLLCQSKAVAAEATDYPHFFCIQASQHHHLAKEDDKVAEEIVYKGNFEWLETAHKAGLLKYMLFGVDD